MGGVGGTKIADPDTNAADEFERGQGNGSLEDNDNFDMDTESSSSPDRLGTKKTEPHGAPHADRSLSKGRKETL